MPAEWLEEALQLQKDGKGAKDIEGAGVHGAGALDRG